MLVEKPFFGTWNEENKKFWVSTMQDHQDHDRLISGAWFEEVDGGEFKGCFFGCAMQTNESPLEKSIATMGLPPWLIYLSEKIYEGLPDDERLSFPVNLLKSIPVGVNLEPVKHQLAIARLTKLADENKCVSECINAVIDLHKLELEGKKPSSSEWSAVESKARSAAWSERSGRSAAMSAAMSAESEESAESAAESAARAAESAAESAAFAAVSPVADFLTDSPEWLAAWSAESKNLIKFLSESNE